MRTVTPRARTLRRVLASVPAVGVIASTLALTQCGRATDDVQRPIAIAMATARLDDSARARAERPTRVDTLRLENGDLFLPSSTHAEFTRSGGVVALDRSDRYVYLFDSLGHAVARAGRKGAGPGEFEFPQAVFSLPNDSIAVWDMGLRRMSYFDAALKLDRTEAFANWTFGGAFSAMVGRLPDGRWVAKTGNAGIVIDEESQVRMAVDTLALVVGRAADVPTPFVTLPIRHGVDVITTEKGSTMVNMHRLNDLEIGIGATCDSGVVLVDAGGVRLLDTRGARRRWWPLPRANVPITTSAQRSALVARALPAGGDARAKEVMQTLIGGHEERMRRPTIDAVGALWYADDEDLSRPSSTFERVDSAGRQQHVISWQNWAIATRLGSKAALAEVFGSDTLGMTVQVAHFARSWPAPTDLPLGYCAAPFRY